MTFLGLDPGYARLGYGVIEWEKPQRFPVYKDCGVIETSSRLPEAHRLLEIETQLNDLLRQSAPQQCAIEKVYFGKNLTTGVSLLQARGVILLNLFKFQLQPIEVTPAGLKKTLSGYGQAGKKQMQSVVKNLLKLNEIPKPDDAADGLALAVYSWLNYKSVRK